MAAGVRGCRRSPEQRGRGKEAGGEGRSPEQRGRGKKAEGEGTPLPALLVIPPAVTPGREGAPDFRGDWRSCCLNLGGFTGIVCVRLQKHVFSCT